MILGLKSAGLPLPLIQILKKFNFISKEQTSKKDIAKAITELGKFDFVQLKTILEGELDV